MAEGLAAYGHNVTVVTGLPHYAEWRIYDASRSRRSYREIVNGATIDRLRHYVLRNPILRNRIRTEARFARAALQYGWGVDELNVVHAGNMGVKQGLENVVAAARLAATEMPAERFGSSCSAMATSA